MIFTNNVPFSRDPRFQFQMRMRPIADALYHSIIPNLISIERFDKESERHILDREFAIDLKFTLQNGMIITGQEKFRQFSPENYSDVTVEYENDPVNHIKGDWFNLSCQLYFNGFVSKDEKIFERWILLDWLQTVLETQRGNIHWKINQNRDGRAKANFVYASMKLFPSNCIIASNLEHYERKELC